MILWCILILFRKKMQFSTSDKKSVSKTTTFQKRSSLTLSSISSGASAPLAYPIMSTSTPPFFLSINDSPHSTASFSEMELPRNPVSARKIGGAALGHPKLWTKTPSPTPFIRSHIAIRLGGMDIDFKLNQNDSRLQRWLFYSDKTFELSISNEYIKEYYE